MVLETSVLPQRSEALLLTMYVPPAGMVSVETHVAELIPKLIKLTPLSTESSQS